MKNTLLNVSPRLSQAIRQTTGHLFQTYHSRRSTRVLYRFAKPETASRDSYKSVYVELIFLCVNRNSKIRTPVTGEYLITMLPNLLAGKCTVTAFLRNITTRKSTQHKIDCIKFESHFIPNRITVFKKQDNASEMRKIAFLFHFMAVN